MNSVNKKHVHTVRTAKFAQWGSLLVLTGYLSCIEDAACKVSANYASKWINALIPWNKHAVCGLPNRVIRAFLRINAFESLVKRNHSVVIHSESTDS